MTRMMGISTTRLTAIMTAYQATSDTGLRMDRQKLQKPLWRGVA